MECSVASECPITDRESVSFGNKALYVVVPPDKRFVFSPDGPGFIDQHGALGIKMGWIRHIQGQLDVTGRRIDGRAPKLRAWISDGYGDIGFQTSYVLFPTPGCWEIVASLQDHKLTFVVEIEFVAPGPSWRMQGPQPGWRETGG